MRLGFAPMHERYIITIETLIVFLRSRLSRTDVRRVGKECVKGGEG